MGKLTISIIQTDIKWENPHVNLEHYNNLIATIENTDLIVLPEMFSSGFMVNPSSLVIDSAKESIDWMKRIAKDKNCAICGSIIEKENEFLYNRFYFIEPNGEASCYDKSHLFQMGGEAEFFHHGNQQITIDYLGFKIRPYICYDLRFPIWNRNRYINKSFEYDLLIYVANWPEKRISHWKKLIPARAIENQSYVLGVNRIGIDGNNIDYNGYSMAVDPLGETIIEPLENKESIVNAEICSEYLSDIREKMPFSKDWDNFKLL